MSGICGRGMAVEIRHASKQSRTPRMEPCQACNRDERGTNASRWTSHKKGPHQSWRSLPTWRGRSAKNWTPQQVLPLSLSLAASRPPSPYLSLYVSLCLSISHSLSLALSLYPSLSLAVGSARLLSWAAFARVGTHQGSHGRNPVMTRETSLGGVPQQPKMLKGHPPRVNYHRVC